MSELPFLPDELITEHILVRVPAKSVGRFRCVSKPWRSLLSSARFARAHLKFQPEGSILVRSFGDFAMTTVNLADGSPIFSKRLALDDSLYGSCRGLILLVSRPIRRDVKSRTVNLFNPITLESLKIPEFPCFNYSLSLGYDSFKDDYKIVGISNVEPYDVGIYSVRMKSWSSFAGLSNQPYEEGGFYVNGCLHWCAWSKSRLIIAAFDLAREEYKELLLPKDVDVRPHGYRGYYEISVLGEHLAMMFQDVGQIDFWVMKEYGVQDSWTKYTIPTIEITNRCNALGGFGVLGEDEIVFVESARRLFAYNWRNGSWRSLDGMDIPITALYLARNFRQSLISPNYI